MTENPMTEHCKDKDAMQNSLSLTNEKLAQLRQLFPEVFSEGKIVLEKLRVTFGEDIDFRNENYSLNWAGKSDAWRCLHDLSTQTLIPAKEESVNFDTTENIFIEGENLDTLKVLLKSYYNSVKMVYIDPPYNTGNDSFIYPDRFSESKEEYLQRIGEKDPDGFLTKTGLFRKNVKENGHYHSNWLNMMMPRLFLAKTLLRDDGVIFVSIDDNEVHNLRLLMNEIFGEENFVACIVWQKKYGPANDSTTMSPTHDYIVCYAKNIENWEMGLFSRNEDQIKAFKNPDSDPRGLWRSSDLSARSYTASCDYEIIGKNGTVFRPPQSRSWIVSETRYKELLADNRITFGTNGNGRPMQKTFLSEVRDGITPETWWSRDFADDNKVARYEMKELIEENVFDTPKPVKLIQRLMKVTNAGNDGVYLDFFAGSGTTAHAVMQLNAEDSGKRKFVCVQLPEPCDEKSEAFKAGYKTIADICKERIRRASQKIQTENPVMAAQIDCGFKVFKLQCSNFKQWRKIKSNDPDALNKLIAQMEEFIDPVHPEAILDNMVYELMLKNGRCLNSKITFQYGFYVVEEPAEKDTTDKIIFMLETVSDEITKKVIAHRPQKVIALNRIFKSDEQLTNTDIQMGNAKIAFETI